MSTEKKKREFIHFETVLKILDKEQLCVWFFLG